MLHISNKNKFIVCVSISLTCIVFLLIVGGFVIRHHFDHASSIINPSHKNGLVITVQDENYLSGIECIKKHDYIRAEELLRNAYDKSSNHNSLEYSKICQARGLLYIIIYQYENASDYLMESYIIFRDKLGKKEDNTIFAKALLSYCDCLNSHSERAHSELEEMFWDTEQFEMKFIIHMLTLKAYNEQGYYKRAYDNFLIQYIELDNNNFVPEEFQSPVIPDITEFNYHEIIGDMYYGLDCYIDARSQYLISVDLLISKDPNSIDISRIMNKLAQVHIAAGYSITDTTYLLKDGITFEDYLSLLIEDSQEWYDSAMYYAAFESSLGLVKTFRMANTPEYYNKAINIFINSYNMLEKTNNAQFYIIQARAAAETGYYEYACYKESDKEEQRLLTARACFSTAIDDMQQLLLDGHAETANLYYMEAMCYMYQGDYELAYSSAKRALYIYEQAVGRNTPTALEIFSALANIEGNIGKFEDSFDHSDYALDIAERYYGMDSAEYAKVDQLCDDIVEKYIYSLKS